MILGAPKLDFPIRPGILSILAASWIVLERLGAVVGASWGCLGAPWGALARLGATWERLEAVLGASWGRLGASWKALGAS